MFSAMHIIAIISLAAVMLNFSWCPPLPLIVMSLSALSFISRHLLNIIVLSSIPNLLPWKIWLSIFAHKRLFALVIAWKSPLKCKFISSIGCIWLYPPPVAPPFIPKTGPSDGSRKAKQTLSPLSANASARPIETVVLPLPAFVGLIAVTKTSFPLLAFGLKSILALYFPYIIRFSLFNPNFFATFSIGCISVLLAIWISVFMLLL